MGSTAEQVLGSMLVVGTLVLKVLGSIALEPGSIEQELGSIELVLGSIELVLGMGKVVGSKVLGSKLAYKVVGSKDRDRSSSLSA